MEMSNKNYFSSWIQASRLPSQSYIFFPLLLGQMISYSQKFEFSIYYFVATHIFGLLIQLYIVYANDLADKETDMANDTYNIFSGGSRVLVENKISELDLKKATFVVIALNIFLGLCLTLFLNRNISLFFIIISLFLLWAYSYSPFKLSYRGGGEFLQMLGVAGVLPLFGYYLQSGSINSFPWVIFLVLFPIHLGCGISTGLSDYHSDKKGNKKTVAVNFGIKKAEFLVITLNFLSILLLMSSELLAFKGSILIILIPMLMTILNTYSVLMVKTDKKSIFKFILLNIIGIVTFVFGLCIYFILF